VPESREIPLPRPYDLDASLRFVPFGLHDPTCRRGPGVLWRAGHTPRGPVTLAVEGAAGASAARATAWGTGAEWTLERVPSLLGLRDDPAAFRPPPGRLATLARRGRGLRLSRSPWVFDLLCQFVLQQRVPFRDAARAWGRLVRGRSEAAPGPPGLLLPLPPREWLRLGTDDFRRAGVDPERANRLRAAARAARSVDATFEQDLPAARSTLGQVPGCGPWTLGMVLGFGLADPDAVVTGDLHLPSAVARALVGEARADDERMLALLEPYRGHRFRLVRLLLAADVIRLGRSGPR
jgi:3-methyladenine DNA glycosylase/8-oxoguanine DNA glycosylase